MNGDIVTDRSEAFLELHDHTGTRLSDLLAPMLAVICIIVGLVLITAAGTWS